MFKTEREKSSPTFLMGFERTGQNHFGNWTNRAPSTEVGPQGNKAEPMLIPKGPDQLMIGRRDGDLIDGRAREKRESALLHSDGSKVNWRNNSEKKHQPMTLALVGFFCDVPKEMKVRGLDCEPRFLGGFSRSTLKGGLAGVGVEFSSNGAPASAIWGFFSLNEKELIL